MAKQLADFSADIDTLYQQSLSEFTEARNTLAKRVKEGQGADAAAAIKALQKPNIPAWVVNQLYWRDRREFEQVLKAGDRLRGAQQERLAGHGDADDLREAIESRQQAIAALVNRAREIMSSAGMAANPDMLQRIGTTIEALSTYGTSDAAPRAGRLVEEVSPPGLEALAALMPVGGLGALSRPSPPKAAAAPAAPPLRVVDKHRPDKADKEAEKAAERAKKAKAAFEEADAAVARAREEAEAAEASRETAEAAWTEAHQALQEARRVLDAAMDREREAQQTRDTARREATRTAQSLERAERTRDAAEREYHSQATD
jgi:hypothetical protein